MANAKANDSEDYYNLLNIQKTATQQEIKKAYKKLAAKLHPDKGGDNEKFQQLQHAYDILSDPNKKEIYDNFGEEGLNGNFQNSHKQDEFHEFKTSRNKQRIKAKTKLIFCKISLEEAYLGCSKEIDYIQKRFCDKCKGTGTKNPNIIINCQPCNGTGKKAELKRLAGFYIEQEEKCSFCLGLGQYYKKDCEECLGEKFYFLKNSITIEIEPGIEENTQIIRLEEGDDEINMKKGDLCIQIYIKKHLIFKRFSDDIYMELNVNLYEALMGIKIPIKYLDGRTILLMSQKGEIIQHNTLRKIKGIGMPGKSIFSRKGDLLIKFSLIFPLYVEDYDMKKLKIIFEKDRTSKNLEKKRKDEENKLNKNLRKKQEKVVESSNDIIVGDEENQKEVKFYVLEKTEKKMEDFIDPDEDRKKSKRYFFTGFDQEENNDKEDMFNNFRNITKGFCQHQ